MIMVSGVQSSKGESTWGIWENKSKKAVWPTSTQLHMLYSFTLIYFQSCSFKDYHWRIFIRRAPAALIKLLIWKIWDRRVI